VQNQDQLNEWYREQLKFANTEEQKAKLEEMYQQQGRKFMPTERSAYRWETYERDRTEYPNHYLYQVQEGENLSLIADRVGMSLEALKELNRRFKGDNWSGDYIRVGEPILYNVEDGQPPVSSDDRAMPDVPDKLGLAHAKGSIYLDIHKTPLDWPDTIGGFTFISREERGAKDLNPGLMDIIPEYSEGIYNSNNQGGYYVYPPSKMEEVISLVVIHGSGEHETQYRDWQDFVTQTETHHQRLPYPNDPFHPDYLDPQKADNRFGNNWADIGYNYLIAQDGTIIEGRDLRARPAHIKPTDEFGNMGTMGVVFEGVEGEFTEAQYNAAAALITHLYGEKGLENMKCIAGHESINPGDPGSDAAAQKIADKLDFMNFGTGCFKGGGE
jgi:hypothetical protein